MTTPRQLRVQRRAMCHHPNARCAMVQTGMEGVEMFGFVSAFFAVVFLGYRHQLRTKIPVVAISMACCAAYGFMHGVWPLGFCLIAVAISQLRHRPTSPEETVAASPDAGT